MVGGGMEIIYMITCLFTLFVVISFITLYITQMLDMDGCERLRQDDVIKVFHKTYISDMYQSFQTFVTKCSIA